MRIRQAPAARGRCTFGDAKGLEAFLCCLGQDQLVQREIGDRAPKPLVLLLQLFQTSALRLLHPTIERPPSAVRLLRHADLAHRLGNRRASSLQNFNLPKLRHYLFGLLSFASQRGSSNLRGKSIPAGGTLLAGYFKFLRELPMGEV